MITVSRNNDGSCNLYDEQQQVRALIAAHGSAEVVDERTQESLYVYEVYDKLMAFSEENLLNLEDLANNIINRFRIRG